MLKIVADQDIPALESALDYVGRVVRLPGSEIGRTAVRDADVLLVRSVTRVDANLLDGADVRFVGTATSGIDHVDVDYLGARGIRFVSAPGCNAPSVADYVVAAAFSILARLEWALQQLTVGVVGYGNVGSRLALRLSRAGATVIVNDPPLESAAPEFAGGLEVVSLDELLERADLISLHVPLTRDVRFSTERLIGGAEFDRMQGHAILINTSRGAVIDETPLITAMLSNRIGPVVLDVFENEPVPDRLLIDRAEVSTPHIAGYALDSKLEGAKVMAGAVQEFAGIETAGSYSQPGEARTVIVAPAYVGKSNEAWTNELIKRMYDIRGDDRNLKAAAAREADLSKAFRRLRRDYPERRVYNHYEVDITHLPESLQNIARAIGVAVRHEGAAT
ncbi:MAG: 4-phosphoerythronate dehydrogenase [Rhodothermia bacterium]|nr:4-phosphoerythronate dehydrogenase [Rhodothermia bacterium]